MMIEISARPEVVLAGLTAAGVPAGQVHLFDSLTDEIVMTESAWYPRAVALAADSSFRGPTWLFGEDSSRLLADGRSYSTPRGLAQLTPWMFERYHVAGTPDDIFDPVSSIAALWRFIAAHFPIDLNTGAGVEEFRSVWFDHRHDWWWLTELAPFNTSQKLPGY